MSGSGESGAADTWLRQQRDRITWIQSYWAEYPALKHNGAMWRSFLENNHMAITRTHSESVDDAEHALLAALKQGVPSEEWPMFARALRVAYIKERSILVKSSRGPADALVPLLPRTSPCPPAAATTTGTTLPRLADAHSLEEYWPMESKRLGEEGTVVVMLRISASGCATGAAIVGSSGSDMLDGAVRRYIESSSWIPAAADGKPVEYTGTMPIVFKLDK